VRLVPGLFLLGAALAALVACSDEACTEMGCVDQAALTIVSQTGLWADGAYAVAIAFGDANYACAFEAPSQAGEAGNWQALDCVPELSAFLAPVVKCSEHQSGESQTQTCAPVAHQFYLQASVPGRPATLAVTLVRDDTTLLDDASDLAYKVAQPNGPECEPTCSQASATYVLDLE
jgi:hypothetical protein